MGDKSPVILTQRKKRKLAAKAKEEMLARFQWAIDKVDDAVESHDNKNNNNNNNNNNNDNNDTNDNKSSRESSFELSPPLVYCSCTEEHQDWRCTWCTRFYKVSDGADDKKEEEEEEEEEEKEEENEEEVEKKNKDREDKD